MKFKRKHISDKGLHLVARFEGFVPVAKHFFGEPYCTYGYGHYGADVKEGAVISKHDARRLLRKDCRVAEKAVRRGVKVKLNQQQFDCLVSFTFNVGVGAFQTSTLLRVLNEGMYAAVPGQLNRWVNGTNGPLPGLVTRRAAEGDLFAHGRYH